MLVTALPPTQSFAASFHEKHRQVASLAKPPLMQSLDTAVRSQRPAEALLNHQLVSEQQLGKDPSRCH